MSLSFLEKMQGRLNIGVWDPTSYVANGSNDPEMPEMLFNASSCSDRDCPGSMRLGKMSAVCQDKEFTPPQRWNFLTAANYIGTEFFSDRNVARILKQIDNSGLRGGSKL